MSDVAAHTMPTPSQPVRLKSYRGGLLVDRPGLITAAVREDNLLLWSAHDERLFLSNFSGVQDVFNISDDGCQGVSLMPPVVNTICLHSNFVPLMNRVANTTLTHVTSNVYSPVSTKHLQPITINELTVKDLAGHHILVDVPLRHLKASLKLIQSAVKTNKGAPLSAIFLVPKGKFFSKPAQGMKLLGEYSPDVVYSASTVSTVHLPAVIEAYLCNTSDCLPPPPVCNLTALQNGDLTMQFDAMVSHAGRTPTVQINVLLDSGASHCFIPLTLATHLGVTVLPSSYMSTGLGNGKGCRVLGECSLSLEIQGVRDTVKCLVLENFLTGINLVLGNNKHKTNQAIVNWVEECVLIT